MSDVKVLVKDNGPLLVTGPITVTDAAGKDPHSIAREFLGSMELDPTDKCDNWAQMH